MVEKLHKNILVYDILYKALFSSRTLRISFVEVNGFIRVYDGIRYTSLFGLENITPFTIELNILLVKNVIILIKSVLYQDKVRKNWSGGL